MDPGFLLIDNLARFVAIVGVAISVPFFGWAGYLFITSMGDPSRSAAARNAVISVCVGVVVVGLSFIIPRIIGDAIVAPSGGVVYDRDSGVNCGGLLRSQLVANRQASDAGRINFVIRRIQGRFGECDETFWTPVARDAQGNIGSCFDPGGQETIAGVLVPDGLRRGGTVMNRSGRDARGNVIVHWTVSPLQYQSGLPADGSICWMYVSALGSWVEGYY